MTARPSAWRVACLGDSVTLGWGIRPEQAWPQMLEELAQATGRDLDVEAQGAVPELITAVSDPRPDVRWRAATALGEIGARQAAPALAAAASESGRRR